MSSRIDYPRHLGVEVLDLRLIKSRKIWNYHFQFAVNFSEWQQTHATVILAAAVKIHPSHRVSTERTLHLEIIEVDLVWNK